MVTRTWRRRILGSAVAALLLAAASLMAPGATTGAAQAQDARDASVTTVPSQYLGGTVTELGTGIPLGGIEVRVRTAANAFAAATTTAPNGSWEITSLAAGDYKVLFRDPTGTHVDVFNGGVWPFTAAPVISLTSGTTIVDQALTPRTGLRGTLTETGTGTLGGVAIRVRNNTTNTYADATRTAADGTWFLPLAPGTYKIWFHDADGSHLSEWATDKPTWNHADPTTITPDTLTTLDATLDRRPPTTDYDIDGNGTGDLVWWDSGDPFTWYEDQNGNYVPLIAVPGGAWPVHGDFDGDGIDDIGAVDGSGDWITTSGAGTIAFPEPPAIPNPGGTNFSLPIALTRTPGGPDVPAWYRDVDATWHIQGEPTIQFGHPDSGEIGGSQAYDADVPVPADYDGDGIDDLATYSPHTSTWTVRNSSDGTTWTQQLGEPASLPQPGDFDGDGQAEPAVVTIGSTGGPTGRWIIDGQPEIPLAPTDTLPAAIDRDGDGALEPGWYDYSTDAWHIGAETSTWSPSTPGTFPGALSSAVWVNYLRLVFIWTVRLDGLHVEGTTNDGTNGQPIAGATVRVRDLDNHFVAATTTDASGGYAFDLPNGWYKFVFIDPLNRYETEFFDNVTTFAGAYIVAWDSTFAILDAQLTPVP